MSADIKTWQERSAGPDPLGLYPDAFPCMLAEIAALRAELARRPTVVSEGQAVSDDLLLAARAEGRAEAVEIISSLDPEDALGDCTSWSGPVGPEDEGSMHWDIDALRAKFHADDRLYDAFARAESMYWDYCEAKMTIQYEAEQRRRPAAPAPEARDAQRYRRLQILGAAPGGHPCLDRGTVLRFQTLDAYIDADIAAYPSRGESKAAPEAPVDPLDWPLPCDITVGAGTIGKGCKLRTLVTRMQFLHRMAMKATPLEDANAEKFAELMNSTEAAPEAPTAAPTARTLSEEEILDEACAWHSDKTRDIATREEAYALGMRRARAILATNSAPTAAQAPEVAAWIDQFGNVFPLGAYSLTGKPLHIYAHKRGWKPLFREVAATSLAPSDRKVGIDSDQILKIAAEHADHMGGTTFSAEPVAIFNFGSLFKFVNGLMASAPTGRTELAPPELTWLYTHCRAIGMDCVSTSGKWEHNIALFTINQRNRIAELEALAKAAPIAEGCPECGCIGLHACPGSPMKEWTPEEVTNLNSVLAEYAPVPVAEAPTEPPEFCFDPDGELCMDWWVGDKQLSISIGGTGRVSWAMVAGDVKAHGKRYFAAPATEQAKAEPDDTVSGESK